MDFKIETSKILAVVFVFTCMLSAPAFFEIPGSAALAQQNPAVVEGFRSARFGMSERDVLKMIQKDFKISRKRVKRHEHPVEKTVSLEIKVKDLLAGSGASQIFYILGFRSKKLIQVNILWGKPVAQKFNPATVVDTANQLRYHFVKKNFPKQGLVVNQALNKEGTAILVFQGKDKKGRMARLLLKNPKVQGAKENANISLKLSYSEKPESADIFRIRKDDF